MNLILEDQGGLVNGKMRPFGSAGPAPDSPEFPVTEAKTQVFARVVLNAAMLAWAVENRGVTLGINARFRQRTSSLNPAE